MSRLIHAIQWVDYLTKDVTDKGGQPFVGHPLRVMARCVRHGWEDPTTLIAAVLHDEYEDGRVLLRDVEYRFGSLISEAVDALARRKDEAYRDYLKRCAVNVIARRVKIADIEDNLDERRAGLMPSLRVRYKNALESLWMVEEGVLAGDRAADHLGCFV